MNVTNLLDRHLATAQLTLLQKASAFAVERGLRLFLVGGTVRDILHGEKPFDLDVTLDGGPVEVFDDLAAALGAGVEARSEFGTAKLAGPGGELDVALTRKETYAHPGALPTVSPGTIEQDLARRDFSINAMAVDLGATGFGDLLDPHGGLDDLEAGAIRVLHPESFVDDATRTIRAVRYAVRFGFTIEGRTERLLRRDVSHLGAISGERVRTEFERVFAEPSPTAVIQTAAELGVIRAIHPALEIDSEMLARFNTAAEKRRLDPLHYLVMLAYAAPAASHASIVARFQMDGNWAGLVQDVARVKDAYDTLRQARLRPSQIHTTLSGLNEAAVEGCVIAVGEPVIHERLELYLSDIRHVRPLLNGTDILALGVPQGPKVGELLDALLTARLDGLLPTREDEVTFVTRSLERVTDAG